MFLIIVYLTGINELLDFVLYIISFLWTEKFFKESHKLETLDLLERGTSLPKVKGTVIDALDRKEEKEAKIYFSHLLLVYLIIELEFLISLEEDRNNLKH